VSADGAPAIAVVGSYGVGLTFEVERVPDAGETLVGERFRTDHGGKGSNQAVGAARLGARVSFLTAVGDDAFATEARRLWVSEGVDARSVVEIPGATMAGAILVERGGENRIVIAPGALASLTPQHVDGFATSIAAADVCLVQLEIPVETARRALDLARAAGVRSVLNPAPAPARPLSRALLELVDYLTPNATEAARLGQAVEAVGTLVLTLGPEGAQLGHERISAFPARPLDTTGAGDAFNAAFAVALAEGRPESEAVRWGCAAGAHMVERAGVIPGLPTRIELEQRLAAALPSAR
jgi:ribokinase